MPKVYIAAAFRSVSERDGDDSKAYGQLVDQKYINFLEAIEEVFLAFGFETCLPHRDEGMWGRVYYDPATISALCLRHVKTSDLVFAIAEGGRGVHIELGAAAILRKDLILMYHEKVEPSTLIWAFPKNVFRWNLGYGGETTAEIEKYKDLDDLLNKLTSILNRKYGTIHKHPITRTIKAIIDIGSHTLKFKVVSSRPGRYSKILHAEAVSLGIMGDVMRTGSFSDATIDSLIAQLKFWHSTASDMQCEDIIVTGTQALRKATNADWLREFVNKETGLTIKILGHKEELDYVYQAVQSTFKSGTALAVLNLGGGSTQVGIGDNLEPTERYFLEFGTQEITRRWPWNEGFPREKHQEIINFVRDEISVEIPKKASMVSRLVHTGGELDFMLKCQVPLLVSSLSAKHVSEIPIDAFREFSYRFAEQHPQIICADFQLDPRWASGAVAANAIALCIAERFEAKAIVPSNLNISDGLLLRQLPQERRL